MEPISWKKESFWKEPHQKKFIHWNEVELKIKTLGCIFLESDKISKKTTFLQKKLQFLEKTQKRRFQFETWAATKVKKTLIFDAIKQHGPPLRVGQFGNRVISSSPRSREFESCYLKTFFQENVPF